jgi:hypothetical protein
MKTTSDQNNQGSVLMMTLVSIAILALICATSLYVTSQNTGAGMQTAAWQQALTAAESGVDAAVYALNTGDWSKWKTASASPSPLPTAEPSGGSDATAKPTAGTQYNYLPSSALTLTAQGEGVTGVSAWVTIDAPSGLSDSDGQWYRIRSTGQSNFPSNSVLMRVSNNRLDSDLRNTVAMHFNRKGGTNLGPSRTIEVVMQPVPQGGSATAITLANWLAMTGGGSVDAFSSPSGQWSTTYRDTSYPMLVAEGATGNSAKFANTGQTYVYGGVTYSGTAPKNVNAQGPPPDVMGQVSTPADVTLPTPTDPVPVSGQSGHYTWSYQNPWSGVTTDYAFSSSTSWTGGGGLPKDGTGTTVTSVTAQGTAGTPGLIVINGDFTVSGGSIFSINASTTGNPPVTDSSNSYLIVWVKGKFTTSGSGQIMQGSGTHVTWIVDNDITTSGNSYNNLNGTAATDSFVGVGNHKFTDSGSATFTGTVNAPGYDGTISGSGDYTGGFAGSTLTISGGASFHYDEALNGGGTPGIGNYAFASWFEDNSDPNHNDVNGNPIVY